MSKVGHSNVCNIYTTLKLYIFVFLQRGGYKELSQMVVHNVKYIVILSTHFVDQSASTFLM